MDYLRSRAIRYPDKYTEDGGLKQSMIFGGGSSAADKQAAKKQTDGKNWKQASDQTITKKLKFTYNEQREYDTIDADIAALEEKLEKLFEEWEELRENDTGIHYARTKDEILASIKSRIGEDNSDEAIALIEDINDSFDDLTTRVSEAGDWKAKYEENDKEWRDKYKERFFTPSEGDPLREEIDKEEPDKPKVLKFEDLFTTN